MQYKKINSRPNFFNIFTRNKFKILVKVFGIFIFVILVFQICTFAIQNIDSGDSFVKNIKFGGTTNHAKISKVQSYWAYTSQIYLSTGTPMNDYQVKVILTTSNFDYSKANVNGNDIRFVDTPGGNNYNYWIQNWNATGTSIIWVEVTTAGTTTFYMIYGNPAATSQSNGDNTFIFFDDFSGPTLNTAKWGFDSDIYANYSFYQGNLAMRADTPMDNFQNTGIGFSNLTLYHDATPGYYNPEGAITGATTFSTIHLNSNTGSWWVVTNVGQWSTAEIQWISSSLVKYVNVTNTISSTTNIPYNNQRLSISAFEGDNGWWYGTQVFSHALFGQGDAVGFNFYSNATYNSTITYLPSFSLTNWIYVRHISSTDPVVQSITPIIDNAININGDVDFDTQAVTNNWAGDGSSGNPYIIETLDIEQNSTLNLISIQNTNRYFKIQNSIIIGTKITDQVGIYLNNVQNAYIANVTIKNTYNGIYVYNSNVNNQFINNTITNNLYYGMFAVSSNTLNIQNNIFSYNGLIGLSVVKSNFTTVVNNSALYNKYSGFLIYNSTQNTVTNNYAFNNSQFGFYLYYSSNNTLTLNKASFNTWDGFMLALFSENNTVKSNEAYQNYDSGFEIRNSTITNKLENNTANNNSQFGFKILTSINSIIVNNSAYFNNYCGFYLSGVNSIVLTNNTIYSNLQSGMKIERSNNFNISFNNIYNNNIDGILVNITSSTAYITNNNIYNNVYYGIYIEASSNIHVTLNSFINNHQGNKQGFDSGLNNLFSYNVWSDATGPDTDGNYIIDTGYLLDGPSGTIDTNPYYQPHSLSIPIINSPIDLTIYYNVSGYSILWTVKILWPATYNIYDNSTLIVSAGSIASNAIYLSLNNFAIGMHNVTVQIFDSYGRSATDLVLVNVIALVPDTTPPTISNPVDTTIYNGSIGHTITWNGNDVNPWSYIISDNGTTVYSGSWIGGTVIFSLDNFSLGLHILNCTLIDKSGNFISDIVNVYVVVPPPDTTPPVIVNPINNSLIYGTAFDLQWNCSDTQPYYYKLTLNGTVINDGPWLGENITYQVQNLPIGVWVFNLTLQDLSGNTASSLFTLTIIPEPPDTTPPSINKPISITIAVNMTVNLIWEISDDHPGNYIIYKNETVYLTGMSWSSGVFQIEIQNLSVGVWMFNLTVFDLAGNHNSSIIAINVIPLSQYDTEAPVISSVPDYTDSYPASQEIVIYLFDQHPAKYELYINNTLVLSNKWTENNIRIFYSISNLLPGIYPFTLKAYDLVNHESQISFIVTITDDTTPPTIDSPNDLSLKQGLTATIEWTVYDANPGKFQIYILPDNLTKSGTWSNGNISVSLQNLAIGNYTIRCIAYDKAGNYAFNDVLIIVTKSGGSHASSGFEIFSIMSIALLIINRKKTLWRSKK